jgi:hypothetical protein
MYYADMSVSGHTVVGPWARIKSLQESFLPGRKYSHTNAHYEKTFGKSWEAVTVAIIQYFEKEILNLDQTNAITPLTKVFPKWRSYHDYAAQIEKKRNRR